MEGLLTTCGGTGGRSGVSVVLEWGTDVLCILLTDGDFLCKIESLKLRTKRFNPRTRAQMNKVIWICCMQDTFARATHSTIGYLVYNWIWNTSF